MLNPRGATLTACSRYFHKVAHEARSIVCPLDTGAGPGQLKRMFVRLRAALFRALESPRGDSIAPVRIPKDLARRLNATLGSPLARREELARRVDAAARLRRLRGAAPTASRAPGEPAPVLVYFEAGRNVRELLRIEELLGAKGFAYKRLDVGGDESTLEFVTRRAGCERDDLPVVFVADHAVGAYAALVRSDVSGELGRLVTGVDRSPS